jgi:tetratricopeptide (TPR) repeat protein
MSRGRASTTTFVLLAVLLATPAQSQSRLSEVRIGKIELLRRWVAAVGRHAPGEVDSALLSVGRWEADELQDTWVSANVLNLLMDNPRRNQFVVVLYGARMRVDLTRSQLTVLRTSAENIRQTVGADTFRKRAAVLHTDAALLLVGTSMAAPAYSSFLLPQRGIMRSGDGEQAALHGGDVNWEFARVLMQAVTAAGDDADVRLWFEATLRYKLWHEQLDTPHFEHAARLFPRDAAILVLNGALHDAFADARVQATIADARLPPGIRLEVDSEEWHLRRAGTFFRLALDAAPDHVEAALRFGGALNRLGRHAEAAPILRSLKNVGDPLLFYYRQLFLGFAEEALGRYDEARLAYAKAVAIYQRAQAPRLALSQLAHRLGDRATAREALAPLLTTPARELRDEPMWSYRSVPGRRAYQLIDTVYRSVFRE